MKFSLVPKYLDKNLVLHQKMFTDWASSHKIIFWRKITTIVT